VDLNRSPNNPPSTPHEGDVCVRCGGLMVLDHYIDLQDDTGQIGLDAWRCMSCGEVIDPVILDNRFRPAPNLIYGTKQRKYAQRVEPENDAGGKQQGNGSGS
jgi:hypothetical protein